VKTIFVMVVALFLLAPCRGRTITVDDDGPADFNNIQAAIDDANDGDVIEVQLGVYTGEGNRDVNFSGLAITVRSTNPNDPNVVAATLIDCNGSWVNKHRAFNFVSGEEPNSVLAGFVIRNGYGPQEQLHSTGPSSVAGGILCSFSSPTITSCILAENTAWWDGGAIFCHYGSPVITDCVFIDNAATYGGAVNTYHSAATLDDCIFTSNWASGGGGIANDSGAIWLSPVLVNCTFIANEADYGGGMSTGGNPTLVNCRFLGNQADGGGAVYSGHGNLMTMTNCMFSGNSSPVDYGGAIYFHESSPVLTNCTLSCNSAQYGGGIFNGGMITSEPKLANCILWDNRDDGGTDESAQIYGGDPVVNYSCVQGWTGGLGGTGNTGANPNLVDPNGPDNIIGTEDDNLRLSLGSPSIDTGNNNVDTDPWTPGIQPLPPTDLDGRPRIVDGDCNSPEVVDMGAYEFLFADTDSNGFVDFEDYCVIAARWLQTSCGLCGGADLTCDEDVDWNDLRELAANWLEDNNP
jgi:predicted outer membrane repeat protein